MKGLFVINNFVTSSKFTEIYSFLCNASEKEKINLEMKRTGEIPHNLELIKSLKYDFVLFWDKDVILAKMLEAAGNRVFNSAQAIEYCDNKSLTAFALMKSGIKTPKTLIAPQTFEGLGYNNPDFIDYAEETLGYPMIVKEAFGSFGQQVYLVKDRKELDERVAKMGYKPFLMQEFIASSSGKDLRINIVGGKYVSCMLRYNEHDFRSNITNGGNMKRFDPTPEQIATAIDACSALGLDFAGVDILFGKDGEPLVCEVNSNPHFKSSYDCNGIDMSIEIIKHIKKVLI